MLFDSVFESTSNCPLRSSKKKKSCVPRSRQEAHLESGHVEYTFPDTLYIINVFVTSQQRDTDRVSDRMIESIPTANRVPRIVTPFISNLRRRTAPSSAERSFLFISTQTRNMMLTPTCFSHRRNEGASQAPLCPTCWSRARAVAAIN